MGDGGERGEAAGELGGDVGGEEGFSDAGVSEEEGEGGGREEGVWGLNH